jgi:hypothetical protein
MSLSPEVIVKRLAEHLRGSCEIILGEDLEAIRHVIIHTDVYLYVLCIRHRYVLSRCHEVKQPVADISRKLIEKPEPDDLFSRETIETIKTMVKTIFQKSLVGSGGERVHMVLWFYIT